jgi:hypothetical protein
MKFRVVEFNGAERTIYCRPLHDTTLGTFLGKHVEDVSACEINHEWVVNWEEYKPNKEDEIRFYVKVEDFGGILINLLISIALTALSALLSPKPKKKRPQGGQAAVGITGLQNTIAPGTPKFFSYGTRKIFGHIIASSVDLDELAFSSNITGKRMKFSVVYFMGVGPVSAIGDVKINGTHLCDIFGPPEAIIRLGTQDQSIITGHEFVTQVYHDGRSLEFKGRVSKREPAPDGRPITYTTKGHAVNRVTFFVHFVNGLYSMGMNKVGNQYPETAYLFVKRKKNTEVEADWVNIGPFLSPRINSREGFFWKIEIENPEPSQWDYQMYARPEFHGSWKDVPNLVFFNVMETQFISTAYPGNALLEIHGIASEQITGFDQMEGSAVIDGRLVEVPVNGIYSKQFTRNRVWIVRDILLSKDVGLGVRVDKTFWDDGAGIDAAAFYEQPISGYAESLEARDRCDVILNEVRTGWDWLKIILSEGRGILIPSGGKFKYIIDKDLPPSLMYSSPGNIIKDSLQLELGKERKEINIVRAEFPDSAQDFKVLPVKLESDSKGSDPERLETVSYTTITRKSQAAREMRFFLNKLEKIRKRWTWKSPKTALISEPFDVSKLAYTTSKNLRGYVGFITGDSSNSQVVLNKSVYLAAGLTYSIQIRRMTVNEVEERTVINTAGNTYSVIDLASTLSFTPDYGDIWAIGVPNVHIPLIQIEEVEFDGDVFTLRAHEHVPAVYAQDATLPDIATLENAVLINSEPRPLIKAQAKLVNISGVTQTRFNVVPGFDSLVGTYSAIGTNTIVVGTHEPDVDDFFNNAYIKADIDPPKKIYDYDGVTRTITIIDSFGAAGPAGAKYSISWLTASAFQGFRVEGGGTTNGTFSSVGITPNTIAGTSLTTTIPPPSSYNYFRFTPYDIRNTENLVGRPVVSIGVTDTVAPLPPAVVDLTVNDVKQASITTILNIPLERDVHQSEVIFSLNSITASALTTTYLFDVSSKRNELNITDDVVSFSVDLDDIDYGNSVFAKVANIDFFGNKSAFAPGFVGATITSSFVTIPDQFILDDDIVKQIYTGVTISTVLYTATIDGGTLLANSSTAINVDVALFIDPNGPTTTTSLDFGYSYGGAVGNTISAFISDGVTSIDPATPYWLDLLFIPVNDTSQISVFQKYGDEVPTNTLVQTIAGHSVSAVNDQTLEINVTSTGHTQTIITKQHVVLSAISLA